MAGFLPKISIPNVSLPNIPVPNIPVPDFKVPDFKVPDFKVPDFKVPDFKVPDFKVPDFKVPEFPTTGYETNKFDLKAQVESGPPPWNVAWADDITEQDAMIGIVSVGVSIFAENPAPFYLWIENLINRTVSSLLQSGENFPNAIINQAKELAANAIRQAISGNNPIEVFQNYDTVDFKAGAIKYSGRNLLLGQTASPTFGLKPYVAFRWRASGIPVYYY